MSTADRFVPEDIGPHTETHRRRLAAEAAEVLARGGAWVVPFLSLPARRNLHLVPPLQEDDADA